MRVFCAVICVLISAPTIAQERVSSLRALLVEYRCEIVGRLEQIYHHVREDDGDQSSYRDRFLAVSVPRQVQSYVQCMFIDGKSKVVCEAASGFHYTGDGESRAHWLSEQAISALGRLFH